MPLRTISLALVANSDPDPAPAVRYALDLTGKPELVSAHRCPAPGQSDTGLSHACGRVANAGDY